MPRKAFVADLSKAVEGVSIAGVSDVKTGGENGEFTFMCVADGQELNISVLIPDLSDYPTSHMCMIFAPDNAPARVASLLNDISEAAAAKTVPEILQLVSSRLESTASDGDQEMLDSAECDEFGEDDDSADEYFPGDEDMYRHLEHHHESLVPGDGTADATAAFKHRIRCDLRAAKQEGFKVGYLGGLMDGFSCYVTVSIRISKLGISEEAMKAWQLKPSEYLVVIFHYPRGYKSMDDVTSCDPATARFNFGARVGISTNYKPTIQEAIQAFTVSREEDKRRETLQEKDIQQQTRAPKSFRNSFISRPLKELLEQRLPMLLKYRYKGMAWSGAEMLYNDQVMLSANTMQTPSSEHKYYEPEHVSTLYPKLVTADHIQEAKTPEHSLPLVGAQFVLRHFVRCTEFCLICFTKMPEDLQAIKPYVCDNPLCLYQYMSLGFGPSIEHEILSQPKVVDLLISFCYASAYSGRLKDFPLGLSLAVPPVVFKYPSHEQLQQGTFRLSQLRPPRQTSSYEPFKAITAMYNEATNELLFEDNNQACPIKNAQWIVLQKDQASDIPVHCRVIDTSLYPCVRLSSPLSPASPAAPAGKLPHRSHAILWSVGGAAAQPAQTARLPVDEFLWVNIDIYNQNFDDLTTEHKREAILGLLDLLPPVKDMKNYLTCSTQSSLSAWVDRLPPAVLGVLRWIIASNRACIVQVDGEDKGINGPEAEDRIHGMPGWEQFRFAMGAPDKERRFIGAVRDTTTRLNLRYPTLFAWHGSPIQNWHSIIREGLHFKETLHGRAFGHGVYHALDVTISLGYAQPGAFSWGNSELKITQAVALNEIVNAPTEFISRNPYLVVAQLDWIQTRYLFVKGVSQEPHILLSVDKEKMPQGCIEQDEAMTPRGSARALVIPIHAISGSRRPKPKTAEKNKCQKTLRGTQYDPIVIDEDDDMASVTTLEEDRMILEDDSLTTPLSVADDKGKGKGKLGKFVTKTLGTKSVPVQPLTDYLPGTLDYSSLPMLQMPAWATNGATKRLMKDFKDIITVQNSTPPHELGWHIDEDKIDNMYQWIVELHSFDSTIPLATDMKNAKITSVVLELRFGKDYPMSPPFVRVIRPRFLSFAEGGGGHVTAGGAMCMQLLTNDGWSAVSSIDSVLLQVRMAISSLEPKPARLDRRGRPDYGVGEAVEAYMRACAVHGWTVPPGFREMAFGDMSAGNRMMGIALTGHISLP